MKKKTSGRRKIEIKRIENNNSRQVTFSKRRTGLFKIASELCVLTGAEMAILVESPGGRVFAFGHHDVDSVIDIYLGNNVSNLSSGSENPTCMHEEYDEMYLKIAEEEKNKLDNVEESDESWWEKSYDNLEIDELEIYIKSMEELKSNVTKRADELSNLVTGSSSSTNMNTSNVTMRADELSNLVTSSLSRRNMNTSNVTMRADELSNLVVSSSIDTNTIASNVDGLLDDQVILPNLDQFLPHNVGITDEVLMMQALNYNSGGFNYYSFVNGESVVDNPDYVNHGGNDHQVLSDFCSIGGPNDYNYFEKGQI